ncbi:hypothetical protein CROQUDRAFT_716058 [Cronartium quercuum f. sp. fusiforme G11]|uniref:DUF7143 domain-containing protein n=1 Tax=Cronartium quercuum f. sp. fusiforme G11 TaxID=708437 RepID=A0A9P6NER7_9BASI|nr:hypothetical protein CROQUDRAFT_716058 [Cronartium quercuum f. sp. fusiforme G11]
MMYHPNSILLFLILLGRFINLSLAVKNSDNLCYKVGNQTIPNDVIVNDKVECLSGTHAFKDKFLEIPDFRFGATQFTQISVMNREKGVSPLKFALNKWSTEKSENVIIEALAVYGATNFAIRSLTTKAGSFLTQIKA